MSLWPELVVLLIQNTSQERSLLQVLGKEQVVEDWIQSLHILLRRRKEKLQVFRGELCKNPQLGVQHGRGSVTPSLCFQVVLVVIKGKASHSLSEVQWVCFGRRRGWDGRPGRCYDLCSPGVKSSLQSISAPVCKSPWNLWGIPHIQTSSPNLKNSRLARRWWHTPLIPAVGRQRQADLCECEASLYKS